MRPDASCQLSMIDTWEIWPGPGARHACQLRSTTVYLDPLRYFSVSLSMLIGAVNTAHTLTQLAGFLIHYGHSFSA
jgi:hypothetical protein